MRRITKRERILVLLLLIVLGAGTWRLWTMRWRSTTALETDHYLVASAATESQTAEVGQVIELLYDTYARFFKDDLALDPAHPKLKFRLYKDRAHFKRTNPHLGWAEAYYDRQFCHAYYSPPGQSPYHWTIHEATHQLNDKVAHLSLKRWMDEGLALYFSTSQLRKGRIFLGKIDPNTYPVWWVEGLNLSGDLRKDLDDMKLIPLDRIIRDRNLQDMDRRFNLYYIHWWSFTHFLFHYEDGKYREPYIELINAGFTVPNFEKYIGPVKTIEAQWYDYFYHTLLGTPRGTS